MKPNIYNFFKFLNQEEQRPIPFKAKLIYAPETLTPQELNVEGDLDLEDCKNLTSLPEGLTVVEGDLNLANCTSFKELPKGLTVEGLLDLRNTPITSLPKGLTVGGNLYLGGTFLTDQTDKQIRDMIGPNGYIKGKIYR